MDGDLMTKKAKKFKDTISITENVNSLKIEVNMESIYPCLKSIQQYRPTFKAEDILKEQTYLEKGIYQTVIENFNDCLYRAMEDIE